MSLISQTALEAMRAGDKTTTEYIIAQLRGLADNPAAGNLHIAQIIAELQQMQANPQQLKMPQD
jgi:hypothetical protein